MANNLGLGLAQVADDHGMDLEKKLDDSDLGLERVAEELGLDLEKALF